MKFRGEKKGQVTVFVIVAILIVALVAGYFLIFNSKQDSKDFGVFEPSYNLFSSCLESKVLEGDSILKTHGGFIDIPIYQKTSERYPFSNKLEYFGLEVPYWNFYSSSGEILNNVPSREIMEDELVAYVENYWVECSDILSSLEDEASVSEIEDIEVRILDDKIEMSVVADVEISDGFDSATGKNHFISVDSNLGKLFDLAMEVYSEEEESLFLEDYSIDILRLYAPVDGFELSCSPLVWDGDEVVSNLSYSLEQNVFFLGNNNPNGDYYHVSSEADELDFYFSRNFPMYVGIEPSNGESLVAKPVGNQDGMGLLGFCFVNYHFVYDLMYPVMVSLVEGGESFQFPILVNVNNNLPKGTTGGSVFLTEFEDICQTEGLSVDLVVYDSDSDPVSNARVYYDCLSQRCFLGYSQNGLASLDLPSCINGEIVVSKEGYEDSSKTYFGDENSFVVLNKLHEIPVEIYVGNSLYRGDAIVTISKDEIYQTKSYSEDNPFEFSFGDYEFEVSLYGNSSELSDLDNSFEYCYEVPSGAFGLTKTECVEGNLSSSLFENFLIGGGKASYYLTESDLEKTDRIVLKVKNLFSPDSFEDLQNIYSDVENSKLEVLI